MSYRNLAAIIAIGLLATSGCGDRSAAGQGDMRGKVFVSTSVTEQGKPRALVQGTSVELRFTDDGRLLVNAGCNHMQGPVSLDGGKLEVQDLTMTAMGCPNPDLHTQDEWVSKLLGATPGWRMDGANLVVTGSNAEIVLAPEAAKAPAALEGGTWTVDSLIAGEAASSVPSGASATLAFAGGKVDVFTGCNNGSASYKVDGQSITFESLVHTDKACGPGETAVEKAVTEVLKGKVEYKVDGQSLALTNPSGAGLRLRK